MIGMPAAALLNQGCFLKTSDFDFHLPAELIAQAPLPARSDSRMLVAHGSTGRLEHRHVTDLPEYLRRGDLMVVNDTRVIPARIFGRKVETGGRVECFFLEEVEPGVWEIMYHASGRMRPGSKISLGLGQAEAEVVALRPKGRLWVRVASSLPFADVLETEGVPPVPPYIQRGEGSSLERQMDRERYQTIYASRAGAVAAPTAGLHFTPGLLAEIEGGGVSRAAVTLHVGPGTFKPVKTEELEAHEMEAERYEVSAAAADAIQAAQRRQGRILAVGSTTVRTLETVARKHDGRIEADEGRSALFIYPPYAFHVVDLMLTNFHLPKSTLLMMVSAFAESGGNHPVGYGRNFILNAYQEAIQQRYRFYSYGDCMLLLR
jgi:S-adenosylmethionine:tRNA ribosyltransferase-isomerase